MVISARERATRRDPTPVAVCAVALVTYLLHGFDGWLTRDLAFYVYAGQQFAEGVPPYQGVLNRAGPLAHMLPGFGVMLTRLVGGDDVYGLRILFLLFAVATVAVVYLLVRDLWRSRWAGVAGAAAFLTFTGFIHYATNGPREKTPMVLFLALCLWAMVRRRWFAAGIFVSLATLTLQIVFFVAMPAVLVASLWSERRVRNLALVVAGGLAPVAVLGVYFAAVGALREAVDGFLLINLRYTTAQPFGEAAGKQWDALVEGYGASLVVLALGLASVVAFALAALATRAARVGPARRPRGVVSAPVDIVALAAGVVTGLVWTSRDLDGWADLFPFLPVAAVGVGGLALLAARRLPARASVAVSLGWTVAATAFAVVWAVTQRADELPAQRASVDAAVRMLGGRAQFLTFNAPQALVLSGTRSPSRYLIFASGVDRYIGDTWPEGVDGFAEDMLRRRPDAVAVGEPDRRWFQRALAGRYEPVAEAPGWVWYLPSPVTAADRAALEGTTGTSGSPGP